MISFKPISPWTMGVRAQVLSVATDMAVMDEKELFGLRPSWHGPEEVVADIASIIGARRLLDGFVAVRQVEGDTVPVAVALAFQNNMPGVADLAMFGREGHARAMPSVYEELFSRSITFGPRYRISMAQVPVLASHRAARRKLKSLSGEEVFSYGPIGTDGQEYIHTIWRF